jgi:hypothetical protein
MDRISLHRLVCGQQIGVMQTERSSKQIPYLTKKTVQWNGLKHLLEWGNKVKSFALTFKSQW